MAEDIWPIDLLKAVLGVAYSVATEAVSAPTRCDRHDLSSDRVG